MNVVREYETNLSLCLYARCISLAHVETFKPIESDPTQGRQTTQRFQQTEMKTLVAPPVIKT